MAEMIVLVDANDQQIGVAEKITAHQQGLLHRAFSVFVIRNLGMEIEILLQQRNKEKYHCADLWTNTCCSHPRENEDVVDAAERRLQEEMGMQVPLRLLDAFTYRAEFANGLIEHEYDHVLAGIYTDEPIIINPEEVQNYTWITLQELQQGLQQQPSIYTPWLAPALNILINNLENIL